VGVKRVRDTAYNVIHVIPDYTEHSVSLTDYYSNCNPACIIGTLQHQHTAMQYGPFAVIPSQRRLHKLQCSVIPLQLRKDLMWATRALAGKVPWGYKGRSKQAD
jgi:hypothetical protein